MSVWKRIVRAYRKWRYMPRESLAERRVRRQDEAVRAEIRRMMND